MKFMKTRSRFLQYALIIVALGVSAGSAGAQQLPVPSVAVIPDVPGATDTPDPARTYRFVFDMRSVGDSADAVSPSVTGVAQLINTYRAHGVPADHIEATAVFHGPTIVLVTKDETYRNRTGVKANPNVAILNQLAAAGVKMVVCGVSARGMHYTAADLLPVAHLNMSATVTFFDLQSRGFVKVDR